MKALLWFGWLLLMLLTGCASNESPSQQPSTFTLSMASTAAVNPNIQGEASPIQFQVFELEDDSMFLSANYNELINSFKNILRSNYVNVYDYMITPQQFKFIDPLILDDDTRYIGVMGMYSTPEKSEWKKIIKVKPKGREYHLLVLFDAHEVTLTKVE